MNTVTRMVGVSALVWLAALTVHAGDGAEWPKWSPIELRFTGPASQSAGQPNPFAVILDVTFSSPVGRQYVVPGFYDGDGRGGPDGNVWKVRFAADELGRWTFHTASSHAQLDGQRGELRVVVVSGDAEGYWRWGRLESAGTAENQIRYLKFRDGPYWLKAGCDDPENFLGSYRHFDTLQKRKAAVDYLAGKGINSLYIMTHNIGGDDNDVWPWLGRTASEAKQHAAAGEVRFDIAKLAQWRALFEHMQTRGVVPYLVLEDDSAWTGYDHERYYRQIIARFGDLPAVIFNIGEENNENYSLADGLALARQFKQLDPYRHPLGIHNVNRPTEAYIDSPHVDLTSIQTGSPGRGGGLEHALQHNHISLNWIGRCRERSRRVLVVNFDEGRPELDRRAWWSVYLGGGVWESHVPGPYDQPLSVWEPAWSELGGARAFMESLPFWEMHPHNELVEQGRAFCLAAPGKLYAVYLPQGGTIRLRLEHGQHYEVRWWNPANDRHGRFQDSSRVPGGVQQFTAPDPGDWALRVKSQP